MATLQLAAAVAALGAAGPGIVEARPRGSSPRIKARRLSGKPPMNGEREVARRLRQMENPDCLMNHPTVAARELVFTP